MGILKGATSVVGLLKKQQAAAATAKALDQRITGLTNALKIMDRTIKDLIKSRLKADKNEREIDKINKRIIGLEKEIRDLDRRSTQPSSR